MLPHLILFVLMITLSNPLEARWVGTTEALQEIPQSAYGYTLRHGTFSIADNGDHTAFFEYVTTKPYTTPRGKTMNILHKGAAFSVHWREKATGSGKVTPHMPGVSLVNGDGVFSSYRKIRVEVRDEDKADNVTLEDWLQVATKVMAALENRAVDREPVMLALLPARDFDGLRLINTIVLPEYQGSERVVFTYNAPGFDDEVKVKVYWAPLRLGSPSKPELYDIPYAVKQELNKPVTQRHILAVPSADVYAQVEIHETWKTSGASRNTFSSLQRYEAAITYANQLLNRIKQHAYPRPGGNSTPLVNTRPQANPPTAGASGTVTTAEGNFMVIRDGVRVNIIEKGRVKPGDRIITSRTGRVGIRFDDPRGGPSQGGWLTVGPGSTVVIKTQPFTAPGLVMEKGIIHIETSQILSNNMHVDLPVGSAVFGQDTSAIVDLRTLNSIRVYALRGEAYVNTPQLPNVQVTSGTMVDSVSPTRRSLTSEEASAIFEEVTGIPPPPS